MLHMHEVEGSSPFETTIIQEFVRFRHGSCIFIDNYFIRGKNYDEISGKYIVYKSYGHLF